MLRDSLISGQIGRLIIEMSIAICTAALYHEKLLMSIQQPLYSPVQPDQKYGTGVHWKTMTNVLEIPKHIDRPIKQYVIRWKFRDGKMRR